MTARTRTSLTFHFTLVLVSGLLTSGLAQADDDELSVDGSYNAIFTQFDFVGQGNTLLAFQVTLQGPFELSIGGITRTGTITFPHLLNIPTDNSPGFVIGSAAWFFDDGKSCSGPLAGEFTPVLVAEGEFGCLDGTTLELTVVDVDVVPGAFVKADVFGELIANDDDDDSDSDSDDD